MPSSAEEKNLKSEVAKERPRDQHGHFIPAVKEVINKTTEFSHKVLDDEKLVRVEVNNPLGKVYRLLEQIKQQKAFAFTLKGSLGLAGVAVALSVFGIFGGSKLLCDKGTQTEIGIIKILNVQEPENSNVPLLGSIIDFLKGSLGTQTLYNRIILQTGASSAIHIPYSSKLNFQQYIDKEVFVTGNYDSCSKILKAENIEVHN